MRPANVITSVADVVAGIAISGYFLTFGLNAQLLPAILLCISTIALYSGGIIYNDVFDAELDKVERPERPIPSGIVSEQGAAILGGIFFVIGIFAAGMYSPASQYLAAGIMIACLVYNKFLKHNAVLGPINMGLCRGLNLLLGVSILPSTLYNWWYLAIVPIVYIAAVTMISRGEVHGGSKKTLYTAAGLYVLVIAALLIFAGINKQLPLTTVFVIPFLLMIFLPLIKAIQNPIGPNIGKAVKSGVIALILMNAAWASAFGAWHLAVFIVILLPISLLLSKAFAVT